MNSDVWRGSIAHPLERNRVLRVAIFQRRLQFFRVPIFGRLAAKPGLQVTVFVAEPARDPAKLPFECQLLEGRHFSVKGTSFLLQRGLVSEAARYDVVLLEGSLRFLTSVVLVWAKRLHGASVVWWTSLYDPKPGTIEFPRGAKGVILRHTLARVDGIVSYSDVAATLLRAQIPSVPNLVVAPNVLDTDILTDAEIAWTEDPSRLNQFVRQNGLDGRSVVLFVGRLIPPKRLDDLIRAFALLRARRGDLNPLLVIVGDGPEKHRIQRLAAELGATDDVRFFGEMLDPFDICPFFLHARAFVLPGAGGLALYQALTFGLPVVATHADGTELDLVREGRTGFLCEPGDVESIAARAETILDLDGKERETIATACKELARKEFHVQIMIDRIVDSIERAHLDGPAAEAEDRSRRRPEDY